MRNTKLIIYVLIFSVLLSVYSIFKFSDKIAIPTDSDIEELNDFQLDCYVYIDSSNNLTVKDKLNNSSTVLSTDVLEFRSDEKYIVYVSKSYAAKKLISYSFETKETTTIKDNYIYDFYVDGNLLYFIEDKCIYSYNLDTSEVISILELKTSDIVLDYIDTDKIIFSCLISNVPTTQEYNLKTKEIKTLFKNASSIISLRDFTYGIDSSLHLFRIDEHGNIDTISDLNMLKFFINEYSIVYIDELGKLNTIDSNGTNRVIADSVNDFIVIEDYIYYISPSAKNKIIKIHLSGRNKEFIIENANNNFNFNELKLN